jgi:hypothetical protein
VAKKEVKMRVRWIVLIALLGIPACVCLPLSAVWLGGRLKHTPGSGPAIRIVTPHYGDRVPMERVMPVQSEASDTTNLVSQVELWVDGELQDIDGEQDPGGAGEVHPALSWQPSSPGSHSLIVRAVNGRGSVSQAIIVVEAVEGLFGFGPQGEEIYLGDLTSVLYVASEGETIANVSESRDISVEDILILNPDLDADQPLAEGQLVGLPFDPEVMPEEESEHEEPPVAPQSPEGEEAQQIAAQVRYHDYQEDAWATFTVENTGNFTLESMRAVVSCGPAPLSEVQHDQPFLSRPDSRPPQASLLHPGGLAWLAVEIGHIGAGTTCEGTFVFHSEDGGGGLGTEEVVATFTIEGQLPPSEPIPTGPLGDLRRLIWRIRHGHRLETYVPGDETGGLPAPPSLEAYHTDGCEVDLSWCPQDASASSFHLYRRDAAIGEDFVWIAEFLPPDLTALPCQLSTDVVPQTGDYYYYLVAVNEAGDGASGIVRAQVPLEHCPVSVELAESDTVILEVDVVQGGVSGSYDRVYCLTSLHGPPETRFPLDQNEFFAVDENGYVNIEQYLGAENSRLVTVPATGPLVVFFECYGWPPGSDAELPDKLGEFTNTHFPEDWDGDILTGEDDRIRIQYRINPVTGPGAAPESGDAFISWDHPDPHCATEPPAPYDLKLAGALFAGWGLEWEWAGEERVIEGFWILCDGEKTKWVDVEDVDMLKEGTVPGATRYNEKLDAWLQPYELDCDEGCNLSVLAGLKEGPGTSNPCWNSPVSEEIPNFGGYCPGEINIRFDSVTFGCIHELRGADTIGDTCGSSDLTFGWIVIGGREVVFLGTPVDWELIPEDELWVRMTSESGGISPDSYETVPISQLLDDYNFGYFAISGMDYPLPVAYEPIEIIWEFWDYDSSGSCDLLCEGDYDIPLFTTEEWDSKRNYQIRAPGHTDWVLEPCELGITINPTLN